MLAATYSLQSSRYLDNTTGLRDVPNSPTHLASFKGGVPIIARALHAMTRVSIEGPRFDRLEQATDEPQSKTEVALVWDAVLSGEAEKVGVRYSVGVYNALDARYTVPVSSEFRQRTIAQSGRTFYLSASYSF
jgi:outer membrane receptor protein involved in Fe transport